MNYRLLALDLDDTLLNDRFEISSRNVEAVQRAMKEGILVTIATGRMFRSTLPYARRLGVELPLITYHGAKIKVAGSGEVLWHNPVPFPLARDILSVGSELKVHQNLYLDDTLYVKEENRESRLYQEIASIPVHPVGDLVEFLCRCSGEPTKISIIDLEGRLPDLQQLLKQKYSPKLTVVQSRPHFLEITQSTSTKGQALKYLAEREGISPREVCAVGDSYNDIDMLAFAGLGAAMGNAPQEVKDAADIVIAPNTEDGVARFVEDYLLS